jgi:hypothetical protein
MTKELSRLIRQPGADSNATVSTVLAPAPALNEVSAGPESQVLPWEFEGKPATARVAAAKVIKQVGARVYLSSRRDGVTSGTRLKSKMPGRYIHRSGQQE